MAAKLMNSSDESSIGSAVYFSNSVLTENLYAEKDLKHIFVASKNTSSESISQGRH